MAASTPIKAIHCVKGLIALPLGETLVETKLKVGCEDRRPGDLAPLGRRRRDHA
jgi:hypothetical protein